VAIAPRPLLALIEDYSPQFNLAAEHIRRLDVVDCIHS